MQQLFAEEKKQQFPLHISRAGNNRRQLKWVNRVTEPFTFCLASEVLKFCVAFKQMHLLYEERRGDNPINLYTIIDLLAK